MMIRLHPPFIISHAIIVLIPSPIANYLPQPYYIRREHFQSFSDEDDPERVKFLVKRGEETRVWLAQKYKLEINQRKQV